jgi:hypothetical protein
MTNGVAHASCHSSFMKRGQNLWSACLRVVGQDIQTVAVRAVFREARKTAPGAGALPGSVPAQHGLINVNSGNEQQSSTMNNNQQVIFHEVAEGRWGKAPNFKHQAPETSKRMEKHSTAAKHPLNKNHQQRTTMNSFKQF